MPLRGILSRDRMRKCRSFGVLKMASRDFLPFTITEPDDLAFFAQVRLRMDRSEASAITAARRLAASAVTDDGDAIRIGGELMARITSSGWATCCASRSLTESSHRFKPRFT